MNHRHPKHMAWDPEPIDMARAALRELAGAELPECPAAWLPRQWEEHNAWVKREVAKAAKIVRPYDRACRATLLRGYRAKCSQRGRRTYVSPVVELVRKEWEFIAAAAAAMLLSPKVTPVAEGIDTLELHTKTPVGPHTGARIEWLFSEAQRTKQPQTIELAGVEFEVQPRLVKSGWLLKNAGSDVVLRVRADAEPIEASVIVELHAAALWAHGSREAGELAKRLCEAITGSDDVDLQVTRIDLCADFQGWQVTPEDRMLFTTRAKRIASYREGLLEPQWDDGEWLQKEATRVRRLAKQLERAESPEEERRLLEVLHKPSADRATHVEYDSGRMAFTGFAFGRGGCLGARLYNKSREIRVTRKQWFSSVWARAEGFREPPGGSVNRKVRAHFDVWRLEFQIRREALGQLIVELEGGTWVPLTSWAVCREHLDDVWQTLTSTWLRHGWRTGDDRQALSRQWSALRKVRFTESKAIENLARHIPEVAVQPTLGSVAGYLTTAAAQLMERHEAQQAANTSPAGVEFERTLTAPDFGAVMTSVLAAAFEYVEEKKNMQPEEIAQGKAEAISRRRAFLARRDTSQDRARERKRATAQRYGRFEGELVKRDVRDDHDEATSRVWRALEGNAVSGRLRDWSAASHG